MLVVESWDLLELVSVTCVHKKLQTAFPSSLDPMSLSGLISGLKRLRCSAFAAGDGPHHVPDIRFPWSVWVRRPFQRRRFSDGLQLYEKEMAVKLE